MTNMSYCRFYNTYYDLRDCLHAIQEEDELSEQEEEYKRKLINLCQQIIDFDDEEKDEQNTSL